MTNYSEENLNAKAQRHKEKISVNLRLSASLSLLLLPVLYVLTLAQTPVLGDPSEYTFVANMLGIAHPPGYAFITLVGKLFQTIIPIGTVAWRMHLLAAVSAAVGAWFVFGIIRTLGRDLSGLQNLTGLFGALVVGTAVNHWQHAIHANPHILTATFFAANLYFLTRWWASVGSKHASTLLYAFCLSAGLGITHHPLTVFGFPAYALFILSVWWGKEIGDRRLEIGTARFNLQSLISNLLKMVQRNWKTALKMVGFALLGLSVWLYFPIRSPMDPGFGPTTMNTLNGFLDHVLARGLSDTLPYVSLADQPNRVRVFWSLLRVQFSWPVILLAIFGFLFPIYDKVTRRQGDKVTNGRPVTLSPGHPAMSSSHTPSPLHPVILYILTFLSIYAFVISLRAQDSMAYLIGPFLIVGLFAGLGLLWLLVIGTRLNVAKRGFKSPFLAPLPLCVFAVIFFFIAGPIWQVWQNFPRVSLRDYDEGQQVIEAVAHWADEHETGAVLLSDWEHMTPLWYGRYVNDNWPDPVIVTPKLVAAGTENPWLTAVFENLAAGPVYLSNYRPGPLAGTDFRLRPSGLFYQVVEPGDTSIPEGMTEVTAVADAIEVLAYDLPEHHVAAGEFVPLTLALRAPEVTADYFVPVLYVGDIRYEFTTDSHLITPRWWAGEVIVERFDFALPHDLASGVYPLRLNVKNLSQDVEIPLDLDLGPLSVTAQDNPPETDDLLANFRQRVGLVSASASANGDRATAAWEADAMISAQPGDIVNVTLEWAALAKAEESYTVFVHLIGGNDVPYVFLDYTPLGGSAPTHLWVPKWLPGQHYTDPYRLPIPADLPPGTYYIEVGLYEMVSGRRLHRSDQNGNLNGDRYILGPVEVIE